jgi:hypothetical protein
MITTNREYLTVKLGRFGLSENDIDAIVLDHPELEGDLNPQACKVAIYNSMSSILPFANVSEGGYSVTWNLDGLKLWYNSLCLEIGVPNLINPEPVFNKPKIRNRSNMW